MTEISTTWVKKDKPLLSEFVADTALELFEKEIFFENSGEIDFDYLTVPYMKFEDMLKYINQYIVNEKNSTGYLFYSNLIGTHYETYNAMMDRDVIYIFQQALKRSTNYNANLFSDYNVQPPDYENALRIKGLGSTQEYFDYNLKETVKEPIVLSDVIPDVTGLGKYSYFNSDDDNSETFLHRAAFKNNSAKNAIVQNLFQNGFRVKIKFKGLIERVCGMLAKVTFDDPFDEEEEFSKELTGPFLIENIIHTFTPGEYNQVITFNRNAHMTKPSLTAHNYANQKLQ